MASAAVGSKLASIAVLGLSLALPVLAHGDDMDMGAEQAAAQPDDAEYPPTYFALEDHRRVLFAHIALMTLAWVIFLPVGMCPCLKEEKSFLTAPFKLSKELFSC